LRHLSAYADFAQRSRVGKHPVCFAQAHSPSLNLSFAEVGANLEIKFDADNDALMRFTSETRRHIFAALNCVGKNSEHSFENLSKARLFLVATIFFNLGKLASQYLK
jgi:hypothetical protein